MNPDTGAIYASVDEGVARGEKREDLVSVEGRRDKIDKMISDLQRSVVIKKEERRQTEKKRRQTVEASRRKNRRKK